MKPTPTPSSFVNIYEREFNPSNELIGFESAQRLLLVGGGCLIIVLIFGIILCRLDISAGKKRRALAVHQVEN